MVDPTRMADSVTYAHLWTDPQLDALFSESGRTARWLEILQALAVSQAEFNIIPHSAAQAIARLTPDQLDLAFIGAETRATSHSTLGLIRGLAQVLPSEHHEHIYYGATVQDLTDTWFAVVMRDVTDLLVQRGETLRGKLVELARAQQHTPMLGRTHGQPGAPITFGFKAATWLDELNRNLTRLAEGRPRWAVGQLAGAVGAQGFFATQGIELRERFCSELGLGAPAISWTATRDRLAEFGNAVALFVSGLARIGGEVYELQRAEIAELEEPRPAQGVSSITMPHKRNPESSEHLVTLARLARAQAGVLLQGVEQVHERDGRGWKAEWIALPELCQLSAVAARLAVDLVAELVVRPEQMRHNLNTTGRLFGSEQLLVALSQAIGKHQAQAVLQQVLAELSTELSHAELVECITAAVVPYGLSAARIEQLLTIPDPATAPAQVAQVLGESL